MAYRIFVSKVKITGIGILALLMVIGFAGLAFAGGSNSLDEIMGKWTGAIEELEIGVDLEIMPDGAFLHYGSPRDCGASAEYVRLKGDTHIYRLKAKHGESLQEWCKKLRSQIMTLTPRENGSIDLKIAVEAKGIDENVSLEKIE